jgi:hypothetical protein
MKCYFKIEPGQIGLGFWVLGDIFLQNYDQIYDQEAKRVGLKESHLVQKPSIVQNFIFGIAVLVALISVCYLIVSYFKGGP